MAINNSTLIIGPSNSGKTTFQAQLYSRIQANQGKIKLTKTPKNIEGIENARDRLADGMETETTPATENLEVIIPVSLEGKEFDLVCKDYGGEQVRDITQLMEFDSNWGKRAKENDRWILFVRAGEIYHHYDLSLSGYADTKKEEDEDAARSFENMSPESNLSDQYHYIELLQSLIYARGSGIKTLLESPKLLIAITCWDELDTEANPEEVLLDKMPLFKQFVDTIWDKNSYKIIGLSAQEFPLDNPEAKEKYQNYMPESFGYLVLDDNKMERDLTRLIEVAVNL
jgi:GTPase SAR1 family protein